MVVYAVPANYDQTISTATVRRRVKMFRIRTMQRREKTGRHGGAFATVFISRTTKGQAHTWMKASVFRIVCPLWRLLIRRNETAERRIHRIRGTFERRRRT